MKGEFEMKDTIKLSLMAAALLVVFTAALAKDRKPNLVNVNLQNGQGKNVGTATLSPAAQGVSIKLNLHDRPPGEHAIHIHQPSNCDGPDCKNAGGDVKPDGYHHC